MYFPRIVQCFCLSLAMASTVSLAQEEPPSPGSDIEPITTVNPDIPLDELALLVKPLTAEELKVEAEAWMSLLRDKTRETSQAELAIKQKNKTIEKAEEVQESIEETREVLDEVKEASLKAGATGTLASAEEASELAQEARDSVEQTVDSIEAAIDTTQQVAQDSDVQGALDVARQVKTEALSDQAGVARDATREASIAAQKTVVAVESGQTEKAAKLAGVTAQAAEEAASVLQDTSDVIDEAVAQQHGVDAIVSDAQFTKTSEMAAALAEREMEQKKDILVSVTELRTQRTALADRLNLVLDELSGKLGKTAAGKEHESIVPYRLYVQSVSSIKVDITDTQSAFSNVVGWLRSDLGGVRLARNLGYFLLSVLSFWALGWILGKLVDRALTVARITTELMHSVIVRMVRRVTLLIGIIVGLSTMGINIGPILAVVGAAGFVVAFALQDTLSNFASGIMIMIYQPFDVGDLISVGGVTGEARSMNLVSTTIATQDNQLLIVPNNAIWGNIITNITGSDTRRIDLIFRIGYEDDISRTQAIMQEVLNQHPLVLDDPEPVIAVGELGAVSVNLICRPWARTDDYWQVYREITRKVKERFQDEGLVPPYLQHNVRIPEPWPDASAQQPAFPVS